MKPNTVASGAMQPNTVASEYGHDEAMRDLDSAVRSAPFGPVNKEHDRLAAYFTRIEAERDEALRVAEWLADDLEAFGFDAARYRAAISREEATDE